MPPITPAYTSTASPSAARVPSQVRSEGSGSPYTREGDEVGAQRRLAAVPAQLQGRAPRRPASPAAAQATISQQSIASADPEQQEQHLRAGLQLAVADSHHEAGRAGSGQTGAGAHGSQNASAANRAHASGAAEAAGAASARGQVAPKTEVAAQKASTRLQQESCLSANTRLQGFTRFGMSQEVVHVLRAELAHIDMESIKNPAGAMTPDIPVMRHCINAAKEKGTINEHQAQFAESLMGMAEAANILGDQVKKGEITEPYSDAMTQLIGIAFGDRQQGMDLEFKDVNDKNNSEKLNRLQDEFGKGGAYLVGLAKKEFIAEFL